MSENAEQQEISPKKRGIDRRSHSIGPLRAEVMKGMMDAQNWLVEAHCDHGTHRRTTSRVRIEIASDW